jgi:hypothetical protein
MVELMQQGITVTSELYCKTLKELHRTIQNKRLGMPTSSVVLLHYNAHPYTAARTRALEHFNWELFDHPLTVLIPIRVTTTTCLPTWLQSQCFKNNEELMKGIKMWMTSQTADFFDTGIHKRIP